MKVTVVVPTYNEEQNVPQVIQGIRGAKIPSLEILVIDDGTDKTAEIATGLGARVLKGQGKGLGQAILDGIDAAIGEIVVVMDADLSHSPDALTSLLRPILSDEYDMVIGSRYVAGGNIYGWTRNRILISKTASLLGRLITGVHDATSGYFVIRKEVMKGAKLKADSWKMMLEILVKCKPRWVELPIQFTDRQAGESKFNRREVWRYLRHLSKLWWHKHRIGITSFASIRVWYPS